MTSAKLLICREAFSTGDEDMGYEVEYTDEVARFTATKNTILKCMKKLHLLKQPALVFLESDGSYTIESITSGQPLFILTPGRVSGSQYSPAQLARLRQIKSDAATAPTDKLPRPRKIPPA